MSTRTILFLLEARFFLTAFCIMAFWSSCFYTCGGVNILTTELFSTLKAPRSAASCSNNECSLCGEAASENIVTSIIFQCPTPGAGAGDSPSRRPCTPHRHRPWPVAPPSPTAKPRSPLPPGQRPDACGAPAARGIFAGRQTTAGWKKGRE